ncbi:hypothetical protein RDV64_07845 [Acuticoccus sp. MNP-M23]|uniref:LPS assembly lipoprotein LptE n=1 Tax=Acuticoccus sp. MNP-M23 TaxID=3072793 RepID=UPI00281669F3|nr:LPS assembly lipoprotein LptE [Acuticoccus sp. MNP-M23]WMS44291.1 hypothetical protein RDV64_07845 [Acuticoccus sp. MNP-M23]
MWSRRGFLIAAVALGVAGCNVRPLYYAGGAGGALSPVPDLKAIVIDPPGNRVGQEIRNELMFLFGGDGGGPDQELYRLRIIEDAATDPLAIELEEDLPAAVLLTLNSTFILSEIATGKTLLTGSSNATASYDFSSQRFSNVRAERDAGTRAAKIMAQNIGARIAAYFAAKRGA